MPGWRCRFAAGVALLGGALLPGCSSEPQRPLNLLLISIDTVRADRLGTYGYDRPTSPVIDALADRSLLFENAYSHAPVTATSHMSLMTGVLPTTHGIRNRKPELSQSLSPELPTLAEILRNQGYRTLGLVAGGNVQGALGFNRGFERYRAQTRDFKRIEMLRRNLAQIAGEPFFVFFHTYGAHAPYLPPAKLQQLFVDPDYTGGINSTPDKLLASFDKRQRRFWEHVDRESEVDRQHLSDLYDGSVRRTDEVVGEVLEIVESAGVAENTIIVLLSDHGEEFKEHGGYLHADVYQELLHVPLILSIPGERGEPYRGQRVERVVRLVDVLPTLLTLLDLPVPDHLHGHDLLSRLEVGRRDQPAVFSHYLAHREYALRRGNWKLIARPDWVDGEEVPGHWELYDLAADPGEQVDLLVTSLEEHAEVFARLRGELERIVATARSQGEALAAGEAIELDEETRRQLEALGYL